MIKRDFLVKSNARFDGLHQVDENGPYEKWKFYGGQENDYFHKDGIPRRLSEVPVDYTDIIQYQAGAPAAVIRVGLLPATAARHGVQLSRRVAVHHEMGPGRALVQL